VLRVYESNGLSSLRLARVLDVVVVYHQHHSIVKVHSARIIGFTNVRCAPCFSQFNFLPALPVNKQVFASLRTSAVAVTGPNEQRMIVHISPIIDLKHIILP
jgi:hypothetical protein